MVDCLMFHIPCTNMRRWAPTVTACMPIQTLSAKVGRFSCAESVGVILLKGPDRGVHDSECVL